MKLATPLRGFYCTLLRRINIENFSYQRRGCAIQRIPYFMKYELISEGLRGIN